MQVLQFIFEASKQLKEVSMAKAHAVQDFIVELSLHILSPVQSARAHLAAFPHILDVLAVVHLLGTRPVGFKHSCEQYLQSLQYILQVSSYYALWLSGAASLGF